MLVEPAIELVNPTKEAIHTIKFNDGDLVDVKCIKIFKHFGNYLTNLVSCIVNYD